MNWEKAIAHKPVQSVNWNQRDQVLYAVGIGGKASELPLVYELHPDWKPFPTYPLVLALKGDGNELSNFGIMKDQGGSTPGMPKVDASKIVHAEQSITILKQIPTVSGPGWTIRKQCVGVKDVGKGLIIDGAQELIGPDGEVYVRMISSAYAFGDYKLNKFAKSIAPAQPAKGLAKLPTRAPDAVMEEYVSEEQALVYRLSGDYNPLHIDPALGKSIGFPGTILHGLCSYGHCARAIVLKGAGGDGSKLTYMSARFTSPVIPGDTLITKMWFTDSAEGRRVDFTQIVKASGKPCLGGGVALIKSAGSKL